MVKALTIVILILLNSITIFSQDQHEFHLDDYKPPIADSPGDAVPGPTPSKHHLHHHLLTHTPKSSFHLHATHAQVHP